VNAAVPFGGPALRAASAGLPWVLREV